VKDQYMTKGDIVMRPALIGLLLLATGPLTLAEEPAAAPPTLSVSRDLGLHAYPARNQVAAQQQKDEVECYRWAAQDSGFNPLAAVGEQPPAAAPSPAPPNAPSATEGGAKGAVVGAAAGALIGAIAGDTGKGAGVGAATGLLGGVVIAKHKQKEAQKEADREQASPQAATKAETQQKLDGFKKAYGACMEAKSYVVK
jgi:Glycine-zipper domain